MKEILELLSEVKGEGKGPLINIYIAVSVEFKSKPSSVKFHHIEVGGMGRHVKEVMNIAVVTYDVNPEWYGCTRDDVIVAAFVHDFSKLGRYKALASSDWRRQQKYGGQEFEYDKSKVYLSETADVVLLCARAGLILPPVVVNAVTFHHGFSSESARDNFHSMEQMTPLSVLLHFADMLSVKAYDKR